MRLPFGRKRPSGPGSLKHEVFGLRVGMDRASVLERLGPPTHSISMGEALAAAEKAGGSVVGPPPSDTEAWQYKNTPPGHEIDVVIEGGRLESAEVYATSSTPRQRIWSAGGAGAN